MPAAKSTKGKPAQAKAASSAPKKKSAAPPSKGPARGKAPARGKGPEGARRGAAKAAADKAMGEAAACIFGSCQNIGAIMQHAEALRRGAGEGSGEKHADEIVATLKLLLREAEGLPSCALKNCAEKLAKAAEAAVAYARASLEDIDPSEPGTKEALLRAIRKHTG